MLTTNGPGLWLLLRWAAVRRASYSNMFSMRIGRRTGMTLPSLTSPTISGAWNIPWEKCWSRATIGSVTREFLLMENRLRCSGIPRTLTIGAKSWWLTAQDTYALYRLDGNLWRAWRGHHREKKSGSPPRKQASSIAFTPSAYRARRVPFIAERPQPAFTTFRHRAASCFPQKSIAQP